MNLEWQVINFVRRAIAARSKSFQKPKGHDKRLIPVPDAVFFALFSRAKKSRQISPVGRERAPQPGFGHEFRHNGGFAGTLDGAESETPLGP